MAETLLVARYITPMNLIVSRLRRTIELFNERDIRRTRIHDV